MVQSERLSARGIAIDTAPPGRPEEFPRFSEFYIETPKADSDTTVVYALLDGPSITGAYRFDLHRRAGALPRDLDAPLSLRVLSLRVYTSLWLSS